MKAKLILTLAAMAIALFTFACQQKETTATNSTDTYASPTDTSSTPPPMASSAAALSDSDKEFATKAAQASLGEVTLGQLAAAKATSSDVKDFGNRMVTDHGKANDELNQLATTKGLTLPTEATDDEKKISNELSQKSGKAFDKAYMSDMVKGHEKVVQEFEKASKDVQDPDLKNWATKTLPVIQEHLTMAKQIAGKVK